MKQLRGARTIDDWRPLEQLPQPQIRLPSGISLVAEITGNDERVPPVDSEPCPFPDVETNVAIAEPAIVPHSSSVHEAHRRESPRCAQEVEPWATHAYLEVAHSARSTKEALAKDAANRFGST